MMRTAAIVLAVAACLPVTAAFATDSQTQHHTGRNGSSAGKTVRFGDTDRRYDARGNMVRKSVTFGDRTHHYDARGNLIGRSSPAFRDRR